MTYEAKGDHKGAIIQLRNALQQKPADGEARLLLGRASLEVGDPVSAQRELRKALEYGQSGRSRLPPLARAMLEQGEAAKLVAEFGDRKLTDTDAEASLRSSVGHAQLQLQKVRRRGGVVQRRDCAEAGLPARPTRQCGCWQLPTRLTRPIN